MFRRLSYYSAALWESLHKHARPLLDRYGPALAVVAAAVLLRFWLEPALGGAGFGIFLAAMIIAAWVGGLGPSLICQTLLLFAHALWFSPMQKAPSPLTVESIVSFIAYYSVGSIVAVLSEAWQSSRQKLQVQTQEAMAQRERLRTTLICMGDGVVVTDDKGRITAMNPAAEKMTGWTLAEFLGKPVKDVFAVCDERTKEIVENPVQRVLREKQVLQETMRLISSTRKDRRLPVSYSAAPIRDRNGNISGVVLVIRDEMDRRRSEEALRDADRRKDEFLATLAHELRNPLAPICMGLELMKSAAANEESVDEIRNMMDRQAKHMVRLIDDLLDVSRITRGKLELRRCQVAIADIIQNAVEAAQPAINEANHHLALKLPEEPILIYADPNRLTQVLSNLLDNAAKYTPSGGMLELAAALDDGELVISVSDSGCGLSSDQLDSIFEMFMQVRSTMESGHKGLGIGLTLVKQLVHMHGGSVEVESEGVDRGSTFRIRLPAAPPAADQHLDAFVPSQAGAAPAPRRVLVVDDNADVLKSMSMMITQLGNDVYQARDGEEAVETAQRVRPDVVLMDIGMPKLNGYDAARRMREESWGREAALVAMTGWGQEEDQQRTKQAGFDAHLVKPVDPRQLHELLVTLAPGSGYMRTEPAANPEGYSAAAVPDSLIRARFPTEWSAADWIPKARLRTTREQRGRS